MHPCPDMRYTQVVEVSLKGGRMTDLRDPGGGWERRKAEQLYLKERQRDLERG